LQGIFLFYANACGGHLKRLRRAFFLFSSGGIFLFYNSACGGHLKRLRRA
jgi:hypothetical protein